MQKKKKKIQTQTSMKIPDEMKETAEEDYTTDLAGMVVGMVADKTGGLSLYSASNDAHTQLGDYKVRYIKM